MKSCPECGSNKIGHNQDGLVCNECGLVIEESIYSGDRIIS